MDKKEFSNVFTEDDGDKITVRAELDGFVTIMSDWGDIGSGVIFAKRESLDWLIVTLQKSREWLIENGVYYVDG